MEQNKLEKSFKNHLNSRKIEPSNAAWQKLELKLNSKNNHKKQKFWRSIAAIFIGVIAIASLFFIQTNDTIDNKIVLATKKKSEAPIIKANINKEQFIYKSNAYIAQKNINKIKGDTESPKSTPNLVTEETKKEEIINVENGIVQAIIENNPKISSPENTAIMVEINNPAVTVNSKMLLSQVEEELKLTFRQKVLKTIIKNYKATKDILVSRNQE
jgi:cytoskeletal protein RodZ